jgi:6-phosphogluconate dehydrogenase
MLLRACLTVLSSVTTLSWLRASWLLGAGVSGGEFGARHGPSLMPGGSRAAYDAVEDVLRRIAAQTSDGPCVTFCGAGGAGHFAKMVHNGLEYGDMQLIVETHDMLRSAVGMHPHDEASLFEAWNAPGSALGSYLLEITAAILRTPDTPPAGAGGGLLLDKIEDVTSQKGTGRWTVEQAAELSVATPTLSAGLEARFVSADKAQRVAIAARMERAGVPPPALTSDALALLGVDDAQHARDSLMSHMAALLYCSKIAVYAQGFALLRAKAQQRGWGHNAAELARIWKAGCIIRAAALDDVRKAFLSDPELPNLLLDERTARVLAEQLPAWRAAVATAVMSGVAVPAASASLAYVDAMRRARGPSALSAAQRDYFGSHTYQRTDAKGAFHTERWGAAATAPTAQQ